MDRIEWERLRAEISGAWPNSPLDSDQEAVYFQVLEPLSADAVADAILASVRDGATSPPAAGQLFLKARDLERLREEKSGSDAGETAVMATKPPAPPPGAPQEADDGDGTSRMSARAMLIAALVGGVVALGAGFGIGFAVSSASSGDPDAARAEGYEAGQAAGAKTGFARGDKAGFARGKLAGYRSGRAAGLATGKSTGYQDGFAAGTDNVWGAGDLSPSSGEWRVVKVGSDKQIIRWLTAPIYVGDCILMDREDNFKTVSGC